MTRPVFRPQSMRSLVERAAEEAGCTVGQILGGQRSRRIVEARHKAMYDAWLEGFSYPQIGRMFNRDHTTVMHAVKKAQGRNPRYPRSPQHFPHPKTVLRVVK